MALFAKLQGGATAAPARPRTLVGTPEFTQAARRDYAELVSTCGGPRLPAAFQVKTPPPAVQAAVDAFERQHRGTAEVALNTIDGQRTYQVQIAHKGQAQVLLVDARGVELARGAVRGTTVAWR
ncbi:MAG: hypothetical protein ACOZQL_29875 [Myxococcota bacterium]